MPNASSKPCGRLAPLAGDAGVVDEDVQRLAPGEEGRGAASRTESRSARSRGRCSTWPLPVRRARCRRPPARSSPPSGTPGCTRPPRSASPTRRRPADAGVGAGDEERASRELCHGVTMPRPSRRVPAGAATTAEEAGGSVALGLVPVVGPASGLEVGVPGRAAVGDRVDVVPLQAVTAVAAGLDAAAAVELGQRAELEGGTQLGGDVAPEVRDRLDALPVVQHRLDEGVLGQLTGDDDRHRSAADDVADLARMDMAPPVGPQVRPRAPRPSGPAPSRPATSLTKASAACASRRSLIPSVRGPPEVGRSRRRGGGRAVCRPRGAGRSGRDHAGVVSPVPQLTGPLLLRVQLLRVGRREPSLARPRPAAVPAASPWPPRRGPPRCRAGALRCG